MESATAIDQLGAACAAQGPDGAGEAVAAAVAELDGRPSVVLAFPTGLDPARAAVDARAAAEGAIVVGMPGSGAIGQGGAFETGCSALAFHSDVQAGVGVALETSQRLRDTARHAVGDALALVDTSRGHPLVLLFLDAGAGDQADAIAGAYEAAGPRIPLAGGGAGGTGGSPFAGARPLPQGIVAVALVAPRPIGVGVAHGCRPFGVPSIVTRSRGHRILELDGRPAARTYLEGVGFRGVDLDDEEFEALAVTHPLAQPELNGTRRVRHILRREGEDLVCATPIPPNAAVEYTHETPDDIVATAGEAVQRALAGIGGGAPRAALMFDCAGRKRAVAGALPHEIAAMLDAFGRPLPPLAGLFTHGEVARVRGAKGDRNHALVAVAFG
jgi:hypothetical protein